MLLPAILALTSPRVTANAANALLRAGQIGATHWAGCYNRTTAPYLQEGVDALAAWGTRVVKLAMTQPAANYPWNSDWPSVWAAPVSMARHPYCVFANPNIDTFILVTYSTVSVGNDNYWINGASAAELAQETAQFEQLAAYLLSTYAGTGKTFVLQHWEGDWSIRGDYNASQAPTQTAIAGMIAWLGARQAGVEAARAAFRGAAPPGVAVLHASEVNLVRTSIDVGFPNVVNTVLPGVAVDAVSYSAYDTEADAAYFGRALDFIAAHHLRTPASPVVAVYVGEYGLPFNQYPLAAVQAMVTNVVDTAIAFGCPYIMWWELYCNEPIADADRVPSAKFPIGGRARGTPRCPVPVTVDSAMRGFWLVEPDGSYSWAYGYLQSRM